MQKGLIAPMTGHVGDGMSSVEPPLANAEIETGNFHAFILYGNEDEFKAAQEIVDSMNRKAIELDGTCTRSMLMLLPHRLTMDWNARHG